MSRHLLLLAILSIPRALSAQESEALLQHRVAALQARSEWLHRMVARRDSVAAYGAGNVVIGKAPLYVRVPSWAVPQSTAAVEAIVDSWALRVGPLFTRAPAETLTVAFRSDTAGWTKRQIRELANVYPDVIAFNTQRAGAWRVQRELGMRLVEWLGSDLPSAAPAKDRRDAIVRLASDSSGVGRRCLEGDAAACGAMLRRGGFEGLAARRSLLAAALDRSGTEGWSRLAADTTASEESRVAAVAGISYDQLVANWIAHLRAPAHEPLTDGLGASIVGLLWAAALFSLFAWSIGWHRA